MESLYRKYRPQTFSDVVGQQHVVGTLERAVMEGRTSHAYLFCGPRGTGKTTMARLLAKALMCEQGVGNLPDGTCEQCRLIAAGEHPDVYELDAASRTGVDNVREEIINRVGYAPVQARYKVYIVDEVHMLTTQAFNALLKTLEEPPGHVVFVLCTTDPQKIPATILSRVQRFDFRPIGNDDILARLTYVCEQEGFTYEDAALELVVRNARGGMRDALSSLEQLSVFGGGVIGLEAAQDLLGAVPGSALGGVVRAMAERDVASLFTQVGALVDSGRDLLQFTRELAAHLRDVYVVSVVGANPAVLPAASDVASLQSEAVAFGSSDRLARILTLLGDVSRQMSTAPNQRLVLEIAFTRIARPEEDLTLDSLAERVAALEGKLLSITSGQAVAVPAAPVPAAPQQEAALPQEPRPTAAAPVANPAPSQRPAVSQASVERRPAQPASVRQPVQERQAPAPRRASSGQPARPAPAPQQAPAAKPAPGGQQSSGIADPGALQRMWRQVVAAMLEKYPPRGSLLASATAKSDDGTKLTVTLPKGSGFALKMLERPDIRSAVEEVTATVFGTRSVMFEEGLGSDLTLPQQRPARSQTPTAAQAQPSSPRQASAADRPVGQGSGTAQAAVREQPVQDAPGYPMPWDAPAVSAPPSTSYADEVPPAAYYDAVPYEEFDGGVYDAGGPAYTEEGPVGPPAVQAGPDPAAPQENAASVPATSTSVSPALEPSPVSVPEPKPALTDLPPELSVILENAFEVFGTDVKVQRS